MNGLLNNQLMNTNNEHKKIRTKVEQLLLNKLSIEEIAKTLNLKVGTRFEKKSAKWYRYCVIAKNNQKKAIEKHPKLYSKAGKAAQKKHPWLGSALGKKYGPIQGKKRANELIGNS